MRRVHGYVGFDFDVAGVNVISLRVRLGADERDVQAWPRPRPPRAPHCHTHESTVAWRGAPVRVRIGRDACVLGARRDEQEVAVIERPQPAVGGQLLARGLRMITDGPVVPSSKVRNPITSKKATAQPAPALAFVRL